MLSWRSCFRLGILVATATTFAAPGYAAEKARSWVEVRSPHFVVISDAGERQARRIADQFEQIRAVFKSLLPAARVDPSQAVVILAARDEYSTKELLPKFWEKKGLVHPAGFFVNHSEKNYVVLNLAAPAEMRFQLVYHEYVHLLMRLNFAEVPLWLNEGFAELYAHTQIDEREIALGKPSLFHLERLRHEPMLPLEVLFGVDSKSPHYNENDKASIFYAQSWLVTHYLNLGDKSGSNRKLLAEYMTWVMEGASSTEAARKAFGDFKLLQQRLKDYLDQPVMFSMRMKPPADIKETEFVPRVLTPGESAAIRGEFLAQTERPVEARALLKQALESEPDNALGYEGMGTLSLREHNRTEALDWFAKAAQRDSKSALAHYYFAFVLLQGGVDGQSALQAAASLRRAMELNPGFATAYVALAQLYAMRGEHLEEALALAQRAAQLEPGNQDYLIALGDVLLSLQRVNEAKSLAERLMATAHSEDRRAAASALRERVRMREGFLAQRQRMEAALAAEEADRKRRQNEREAAAKTVENQAPVSPESAAWQAAKGLAVPNAQRVTAEGWIAAVSCPQAAEMFITLDFGGGLTLKLHAANYHKVEFTTLKWQPPPNFNPCAHIRGLKAEIVYLLPPGAAQVGEIVAVEIRK